MAERDCFACQKKLGKEQFLPCSRCEHCYHLGKCSGTRKKRFKGMKQGEIDTWKRTSCADEENESSDSDSSNISRENREGDKEPQHQGATALQEANLDRKLGMVLCKLDSVDKKVDKQNITTQSIETFMEVLSTKYEELLAKIGSQETEMAQLKLKTEELQKQLSEKDAEIACIRDSIESAEQYSRRKNLEIHGIAESPKEDLFQVLVNLSGKMEIEAPERHSVEAVHRLKSRQDKVAPIIVRFTDQATKDLWITKKKALRAEEIFLNDNLTKAQGHLFWQTRKQAKEKGYKFAWTKNGKVLVRKEEGSKIIGINGAADLAKLT
ncbi:hypothetical protein HPB48_012756 [Haemaphysalis longicornis]|uniref:FP protein C-terminal domain-containing protein n=1 Tax=Haemaphysalis longicornis TaxID=44386 RepID=A0A9J6GDG7_HAELO|nr:hypothetical protein HPB48_012756 [Haemaphysalis longicornis]